MAPKENRYTKEHEWVCPEGGNKGKAGLTDYAQSQMGDIVYLDLPEPGTRVKQFEKAGEIESVKAVSDFFAPASGTVLEVNRKAIDEPNLVNEDPYGAGWLLTLELTNPAELEALMDSNGYEEFVVRLAEDAA